MPLNSVLCQPLSDVAHPQVVDPGRFIGIQQQVRRVPQSMPAVRGSRLKRCRLDRLQSLCFQQFPHSTNAARVSEIAEIIRNAASSITTLVFPEDDPNQWQQFLISPVVNRWLCPLPGVKRRTTHCQYFTDSGDRCRLIGDRFDDRVDVSQPSRPKMLNAFFKM